MNKRDNGGDFEQQEVVVVTVKVLKSSPNHSQFGAKQPGRTNPANNVGHYPLAARQ